jgi:hypothetical protein
MPQVLPGGRFLYFAPSAGSEGGGVFAGSLDKPSERVRLVSTASSGLYATAGVGKHYLLWLRGGTLLGQELDSESLKFIGEPHPIADPVGSLNGVMNVSASSNGLLLYGTSNLLSQFSWFDRTGKPLGNVGELASTAKRKQQSLESSPTRFSQGLADGWHAPRDAMSLVDAKLRAPPNFRFAHFTP